MVVDRQQHQYASVRALLADLPTVFELVGLIGGIVAVQVVHRDNGNLCIGFRVVKLAAQAIELRHSLRRKHMRKVADVISRLGQVFDLLCPNGRNEAGMIEMRNPASTTGR